MKTGDCLTVTPGEPLNFWQKTGLELIARLHGGRDVILALDLTGSVDFNDEGRTRLRQIIEESLQSGDSVYVVPFASKINPFSPNVNPLLKPITFRGKKEDIEQILQTIPLQSNPNIRNTDIQLAESFIYRGLAQLNQCRLTRNQPIKPQSVVWITEAPLLTESGITSAQWKETPANSSFRIKNSPESQERQGWLQALPLNKPRSKTITTNNNKSYQLSIVDIPPTVQEFCTLAPGGKENCFVSNYLVQQLWLPSLILGLGIVGLAFLVKYLISLNTPWKLEVKFISDGDRDKRKYTLKNHQKIAIGGDNINCIDCPGEEIRGYLEREGNQIYLRPTKQAPIYYRGKEITQKIKIERFPMTINCPNQLKENSDFEIVIQIIKK